MLDIQKNINLAKYSTFKIGGPAKEFVEVKNEKDLEKALEYARNNKINFFILGGGSNVIFDDEGFKGLIIKLSSGGNGINKVSSFETEEIFKESEFLCFDIWAGEKLSAAVNFSKENDLTGLEWAVGIPGTIGGAVRGNCGAFGGSISDIISEVRILDEADGSILKILSNSECNFSYRSSIFKDNPDLIVISARIKLKGGDKDEIENKIEKILKERAKKQPNSWIGNAGSFFMNPIIEDEKVKEIFEKETGSKIINNRIPAGWLIEEVGLRGKKIGNIMISDINANFLINTGGATAKEVIIATSTIKQKVRTEFGIQLKEEIKLVFNN